MSQLTGLILMVLGGIALYLLYGDKGDDDESDEY